MSQLSYLFATAIEKISTARPIDVSGVRKLNPAQQLIAQQEGHNIYSDQPVTINKAYKDFEVVQNGVSMLVNACAEFDIDIKDDKLSEGIPNLRKVRLNSLLNHRPNPFQDIQAFRSQLFMDFVLEGNIFIYWDGAFLYHLPAASVQIVPDDKKYIKEYTYQNRITYTPDEIIHIQDPGMESIYRGTSRLVSALRSLGIINEMRGFQENFFKNGCVPGLVLETENTLSQVAKDRTIANWMKTYNPRNGAKKPMIIDSGLKLKAVSENDFTDLDFEESSASYERKILKALGIPPILMDGGNNANIAPNLRLFYLETVLPIVRKYVSACERFFGFDLELITGTVSALQPDLKQTAEYYSSLVNAGILTPNEARVELRYPELPGKEATDIRLPANITGSASNPSVGGKPKDDDIE